MTVDTSTEAVTKLLDGVTPGPWIVDPNMGTLSYVRASNSHVVASAAWMYGKQKVPAMDNARFITAARDLVPALLAERDALNAEVERLKAQPTTERPKSWRAANGDIIPLDQMTRDQAVDRLLYSAECHRRSLAQERERYEALEAKLRATKKAKALANNRADQAWNMVRAITEGRE